MGFWSSFFRAGTTHVYNKIKKNEKETQKWNDLFHEISDYEENFNNFLKDVSINDTYVFNVEYINNSNIIHIKREIDNLRKKVTKYLSLGGKGEYVDSLDKIDECIEKVKYLRLKNSLERQGEFAFTHLSIIKETLEEEEDNSRKWQRRQTEQVDENDLVEQGKKILFSSKNNDLKTILYEEYKNKNGEDIKIDFVKILTEDIAKQWIKNNDVDDDLDLLTVSLILTKNNITMYDWVTNSQMYYKHTLKENENIIVEYTPFSDNSISIMRFGELILYISTNNAKKISNIFKGNKKDDLFYMEGINSLSGVEFEKVCQQLIENMGFQTETTKVSGDGGIDLIAYNNQPLLSGKYIIQCKRYSGSVGEPIIRDLYGVVTSERANKGILMTTGYFTKSAIAFANGKPIELIDGIAIQNLFSQYGINEKYTQNALINTVVDVTNGKSIDEVIQNDYNLEDKYNDFLELKYAADTDNKEKTVARYINWLIDKIDSDHFIIFDHADRLVFFKEINLYIKKYLILRKTDKSRLLSYIYQMIYTQNAILLEMFIDAREMFIDMMKHEDIQFNLFETLGETHKTAEIFENTGIFSFLFATWCNMNQLAYVCHDDNLKLYLSDHNLFYGVSSLQDSRISENLELIKSGKSSLNPIYFQKQKQLLKEIGSMDNEIKMRIFFRIDKTEVVESFYDYTYFSGNTNDIMLDFCDYTIENNEMIINNYGNINLNNAMEAYIPYSKIDFE